MDKKLVVIEANSGFLLYKVSPRFEDRHGTEVNCISILRAEAGFAYPTESLEITAEYGKMKLWDAAKWNLILNPTRPGWYLKAISQRSSNYYVLECAQYPLGYPIDGRELIEGIDVIYLEVGFNIDPDGGILIQKDWEQASRAYDVYRESDPDGIMRLL